MRRPTSLLLLLLALTFAALASPPVSAQDVVLDDEVVLSERPRGGGNWAAPGAVLPDDQSALASELYSILQSQPPLLPVRVGLPSRSTLDVTAYPTINRRTGLPCVGCRNPCRSFRYTYARPDRGAVTVEGQRCRRRNGQWVAFEPDTVVGQRPAAPGAPMAGTFQGAPRAQSQAQPQTQAMRRAAPPPLPPTRPGDAGAVAGIAGSDAVPSPFDPPLVDNGPVAGDPDDIASGDEIGAGGEDVAAGEEIAPRRDVATAQPLPGSADDVWATEPLPELSPADGQPAANEDDVAADAGGPLVLTPPGEAPADTAPAAAGDEPSAGEPVDTAAVPPTTTEADGAGDVPPAETTAPAEATATAPAPAPATPVETQTARVVMPFGGGDQGNAVEVETTADPDVVRMLRMLRYLDPETSAEPTRQAYDAAVSDFASDERFALPQSNSALRERLEGAVDRLAALSSCPATAGDGYGACLQQGR
jgi:hypothetical protein